MTGKIINRRVVPDRYEIFEKDTNVKTITFTVPKVNDGVDLSDLYAFINLESENFITNKVLLTKIIEDDQITLTFNIDGAISNSDGITKAQISFESSDLSIIYSTAIFYIDVKASVDSYSNTLLSAQSLYELQSNLTKTLDSVKDKINQAVEEVKGSLTFAELKIDGIVYDGSVAREVRHSVGEINELPKSIVSEYDGETDDVTIYGTYNYVMDDYLDFFTYHRNGIDSCIIKGVGDKIEDENSPYYGKYRIRIQNSNGNYYEPLNGNEIKNEKAWVKPFLDQGTVYIYSPEFKSMEFEIPLKQIFKRNTYYNLKIKYVSGTVNVVSKGTPIIFSLLNKTTLEEKKIYINHNCGDNIPMRNITGQRFFTGEEGEICLKVYINCDGGSKANIYGANFIVVIEESDNPCKDFPLREVSYTDIYLKEPLYKLDNYDSQTGELIDAIYDELDLKNSRVIRRVRKGVINYDYINFDEETDDPFSMSISSHDLYGVDNNFYSNYSGQFRPSINIKSPKMNNIHEYVKFDIGGNVLLLSCDGFGDYWSISPEIITFAIVYPLRNPSIEEFTSVKLPYRKGLNCFEVISEFPPEKVCIKL